jgi:predicted TIM-barrel fold metal-dependent hydrolase
VPGQNYRVDVMAATGLYEDGQKGHRRPTDPALRKKDMERDGVDAEVIFGILGAATRLNDPLAANEMFRIYNDWLVDFCKHDPARFVGLACLPYGDIGAAVLERYPNVRISFGESGIGRIPYALDRMDFEWEDRFRDLGLTMKPSDYWRRQCKGTFQFDRIGTKLIEEQFGHLRRTWRTRSPENAGKFYGLIK